jgi:hypothetical protein
MALICAEIRPKPMLKKEIFEIKDRILHRVEFFQTPPISPL